MTDLDRIINTLIKGSKNNWYFDFNVGNKHIGGGYFYRRADARRMCKNKLRELIKDDSVLYEYLMLRDQP